jgi:protein-tyrosine kinase
MERIGIALEQNRIERRVNPDYPNEPDMAPAMQIKYTHTRSLPISLDLLHRQRVIVGHQPGPFADAYKILRTKVLQKMREQDWNALAITSPGPNAGKTLTAINLAISLVLEVNQTVLLVDANLRRPSVHRYFGVNPEFGLSDYLLDNVPVQKILFNPKGIDRFVILPGNRPLPDSSEMLSSPRMSKLVDDLKSRYPSRFVLFDLPHLGTADALAFAPHADATLLVIEEGKTGQDELKQAIQHLDTTPILGTVLNKAEISYSGNQ